MQKGAPRAVARHPCHFEHAVGLFQKRRACQQVNVGIQHQREHQYRATQRTHIGQAKLTCLPPHEFAQRRLQRSGKLQQIGIGIGHHIGWHGHRQQQCPFEHASSRKTAHGGYPRRQHAAKYHANRHARHQQERVKHVVAKHGLREMAPGTL